jgi:hypothetical protein
LNHRAGKGWESPKSRALHLLVRQDKRDPERHAPLRVRAGDREQPEFLLRAESPADVLGLGQRLVGLTHEMPEFELLQDSAQDTFVQGRRKSASHDERGQRVSRTNWDRGSGQSRWMGSGIV